MSYANPHLLVDTDWLETHLGDAGLRIIDCRIDMLPAEGGGLLFVPAAKAWKEEHIPGATFVDFNEDLSDRSQTLPFMLPSAQQFAEVMSRHGVGDGTRVVLYDGFMNAWRHDDVGKRLAARPVSGSSRRSARAGWARCGRRTTRDSTDSSPASGSFSPSNPRFEIEARAIASLNHPHICQIHDVGPDYLVLEYVNGRPLQGPLAADAAVRLARQVANALEAAHAKGTLHRDLKPSNVLVTEDGTVKLLDFGVAKLTSTDRDVTRTEDGTVVGTAAYMSPEQAQGQPIDVRSDVFSFGAVLYELLAGRRAFEGASTAAVLSAVLRDEPPPLAVQTELDALVHRCLQKDPKRRFPTMAAVQAALDDTRRTRQAGRPASIAVLSFTNLSADPANEYFGDGLAEEIINLLAQTPGLKVIARTSAFAFKGKQEDIRRIAEILDVTHVLEGSVRKAGNRVRVTAQLISARDSGHRLVQALRSRACGRVRDSG